jgi:hypothetical protein
MSAGWCVSRASHVELITASLRERRRVYAKDVDRDRGQALAPRQPSDACIVAEAEVRCVLVA